jgi:hypothetical protein
VFTSTVSPTKYLSLVKVKTSSKRSPKDDLWVRDAKYNIGTTNYVNKENYMTYFRKLTELTYILVLHLTAIEKTDCTITS